MPPRSQIEHTIAVQPDTVFPVKCEIKAYKSPITLTIDTTMPRFAMMRKGLTENDVMPSTANESIFLSGYFDSPAKRSWRS